MEYFFTHLSDTNHHVGDVAAHGPDACQLLARRKPQVKSELLLAQASELQANVAEVTLQGAAGTFDDHRATLGPHLDCMSHQEGQKRPSKSEKNSQMSASQPITYHHR